MAGGAEGTATPRLRQSGAVFVCLCQDRSVRCGSEECTMFPLFKY